MKYKGAHRLPTHWWIPQEKICKATRVKRRQRPSLPQDVVKPWNHQRTHCLPTSNWTAAVSFSNL